MSTIKTTNLQHPSAASPNLVLAADGSVSGGAGLGGLVHINTTTFTTQSSVSINNVFTSTYQNYRLVLNVLSSTTNVTTSFRMRASGTDNTGTNYASQYIFIEGTTITAARQTGQTSSQFLAGNGSYEAVATYDIGNPQLTKQTSLVGTQVYDRGTVEILTWTANHNQATAYDGITILTNTGTITGTIRIYGYKNS